MIDFQSIGELWRCPDCGWLWESNANRCDRCTAASFPGQSALAGSVKQKLVQSLRPSPPQNQLTNAQSMPQLQQNMPRSMPANMRSSPNKAMQDSPSFDSPEVPGGQRSNRTMRSSPQAASFVVEQSFSQMPPQSDGALFGQLLNLDSAVPLRSIFPEQEGDDLKLLAPTGSSSARFGFEDSPPQGRYANGRTPPGTAPTSQGRRQDESSMTPPRPRSELGRMVIPEEGSAYIQKSASEGGLNSSGSLKHRRNVSVGSSSSRSVPGESGRENALNSSDGFRQKKQQSPYSGRPNSSRAMPGEEVAFAIPGSSQGSRGHRSSRPRPTDEYYTTSPPNAQKYTPSSGATTPVRAPSHGRIDHPDYRRTSSGRGGSTGLNSVGSQQTPTSRTGRSMGLSETNRSVAVSETGSTWTNRDNAGQGNAWQKGDPEIRLDFPIHTPAKWLSTQPVADRPAWTMSNTRAKPGGPLSMAGSLAVGCVSP